MNDLHINLKISTITPMKNNNNIQRINSYISPELTAVSKQPKSHIHMRL